MTLRQSIGTLPLIAPAKDEKDGAAEAIPAPPTPSGKPHHDAKRSGPAGAAPTPKSAPSPANTTAVASSRPVILADGTYATQSAIATVAAAAEEKRDEKKKSGGSSGGGGVKDSWLRTLLLRGDYYLAGCFANTFTKLLLRYNNMTGPATPEAAEEIGKGLSLLVALLAAGADKRAAKNIDGDAHTRIVNCIRVLMDPKNNEALFIGQGRAQLAILLEEMRRKNPKATRPPRDAKTVAALAAAQASLGVVLPPDPSAAAAESKDKKLEIVKHADDLISIRQLSAVGSDGTEAGEDEAADVTRAVGQKKNPFASLAEGSKARLNRVYQLSGFADPVYAEAHLTVHEYDIVLDVLIVNQTKNLLQNFQLELNTSADLKVIDRPQPFAIAPNGVHRCAINIKVHSTESGVIFGNLVYDSAAGSQRSIVVLNTIAMDIMDYIHPAHVIDQRFRAMWAEFEWENKVAVNTDITSLNEYVNHIVSITNMRNLTPQNLVPTGPAAAAGGGATCTFLAANLYAKSIFGEDALLNLSVERQPSGKIEGYIRIRSKTQGIALSLGDKINAKQRGPNRPNPLLLAAAKEAQASQEAAAAAAAAVLNDVKGAGLPSVPAGAAAALHAFSNANTTAGGGKPAVKPAAH